MPVSASMPEPTDERIAVAAAGATAWGAGRYALSTRGRMIPPATAADAYSAGMPQ